MLYASGQTIALETSMLTLYNNAYSTCSQKVRLVLAEKSLEWEDRQINFSKNEHIAPEYLNLIRTAWCRRWCMMVRSSSTRR